MALRIQWGACSAAGARLGDGGVGGWSSWCAACHIYCPAHPRLCFLPTSLWGLSPGRSITHGALQALGYCHEAGVVHGALGSGSVMLSSFDDRSAARLVVKLDNVGLQRGGSVHVAAYRWLCV